MINYPEWYKLPAVKFKIINYTYNRETMFIKPLFSLRKGKSTRMIRIHNVQHLDVWMKRMGIWENEKDYNFYYSLAKYKTGIPFGSLNLKERDFGNWTRDNWKEIVGYDFLLDIDCMNHGEMDFAYYSAKKIKEFFDELGVPYNVRFSGRGFHFVFSFDFFEEYFDDYKLTFNPNDEKNIYQFFMEIAVKLNFKFSEMIDTGIYDLRRVVKIPYSIALYNDAEYICRPFEDEDDFNSFVLKSMRPMHYTFRVRDMIEKLFNENGNIYKLLNELNINGNTF